MEENTRRTWVLKSNRNVAYKKFVSMLATVAVFGW